MNWQSFIDTNEESLWRGAVFRFPAKHPFEPIVDFMLIEDHGSPSSYKIICSSGYHAGLAELVLPIEAKHPAGGVSVEWLKTNWSKWIYPDCDMERIQYIACYPPNYGQPS
ncbi:MAG: Imm45 family immunity protein [Proteobacteria bacterium]|nr:Imm45 family immunity protein [Pseudomonadota bacterium]